MTWLMVAVGGALGSMARYGVTYGVTRWNSAAMPYATAFVNVAGCGVAGLALGLIAAGRLPLTVEQRGLLFSGILGGFTTFSGVGIDTLALTQQGRTGFAVVNIAGPAQSFHSGERLGCFWPPDAVKQCSTGHQNPTRAPEFFCDQPRCVFDAHIRPQGQVEPLPQHVHMAIARVQFKLHLRV